MQIDPTPADSAIPPVRLDMHQVTAKALEGKTRNWELRIECSGAPYVWTGTGTSLGAATAKAMADLSDRFAEFNKYKARVMASFESAQS